MSLIRTALIGFFSTYLLMGGISAVWAYQNQNTAPLPQITTAASTGFMIKQNRLKLQVLGTYTNLPAQKIIPDQYSLERILTGGSFNYKGIVYGYLSAGWNKRHYTRPLITNNAGLSLESQISWELSDHSKFIFDMSHEKFQTNQYINGLTQTETGLEYQHQVKDDLSFKLLGSYNSENYNDSPRKDTILKTGMGLNYRMSPTLQMGGEYNFTSQDSTIKSLNMDDNILMLRAKYNW